MHYIWLIVEFTAQVPSSKTLLTPVQCKSLWRQFKAETEYTVGQAIAAQVNLYILMLLEKEGAIHGSRYDTSLETMLSVCIPFIS